MYPAFKTNGRVRNQNEHVVEAADSLEIKILKPHSSFM
jgi:hypothetical protein